MFYKNEDFTWRVSDCEELVGSITGDDGVGFRQPNRGLNEQSDHFESNIYLVNASQSCRWCYTKNYHPTAEDSGKELFLIMKG